MNLFALVNGAPWIFGPLTFAGTITFTGSALLADGSAAAPALAFAADTDTGIFRPGANEIAFVTGGTERASFISQGLKLSNGGGTFTVPSIFANGDSDTGLALIGGNQLALVVGGATGLCFNASANVLVGTTTDSGNGKLQLATGAADKTSGIGLGTDISIYRRAQGVAVIDAVGLAASEFNLRENGTTRFFIATAATTGTTMGAVAGSLVLKSADTTALTLDSTQNATFAGNVTLNNNGIYQSSTTAVLRSNATNASCYVRANGTGKVIIDTGAGLDIQTGSLQLPNAYQAATVVPTGYVTIKDSTGTTYKVCVLL